MVALIIDNEEQIRKGLSIQLEKFCPEVLAINFATGVESGLKMIAEVKPDLVFLDVEMDDGTGFDLVKQIGNYNFQLVFITAYDKYAIDAFRLSAIDFLLKPINAEELMKCVAKAGKKIESENLESQIKNLRENLNSLVFSEKKMVLKDSESIYVIKISDIIYCVADGAYTSFHLKDGNKIVVSKNIKEYAELLENFGFVKPHRSYLINVRCILRFDRTDGGMLVLENDFTIPVSIRKKEEIINVLNNIS